MDRVGAARGDLYALAVKYRRPSCILRKYVPSNSRKSDYLIKAVLPSLICFTISPVFIAALGD